MANRLSGALICEVKDTATAPFPGSVRERGAGYSARNSAIVAAIPPPTVVLQQMRHRRTEAPDRLRPK